jgi:hypothetical protein
MLVRGACRCRNGGNAARWLRMQIKPIQNIKTTPKTPSLNSKPFAHLHLPLHRSGHRHLRARHRKHRRGGLAHLANLLDQITASHMSAPTKYLNH